MAGEWRPATKRVYNAFAARFEDAKPECYRYDALDELPPRPMTEALGLGVDRLPEKEGW
jgi:hypothetical protein